MFAILKKLKYSWADGCYHFAYGMVHLPEGKMKSREGTVVLLEDLISEAKNRALKIVEEKNPELNKNIKDDIAEKEALGAIKYSLLSKDPPTILTYDRNAAMDVNGQAAPYIQYAAVRANSILRKVEFSLPESSEIGYELSIDEIELINLLGRFPQEVHRAAKEMRPLQIANYAFNLAKAFSNFYNTCPVLNAEENMKNFRLRLVSSSKQVLVNSLRLLGIQVPEIM